MASKEYHQNYWQRYKKRTRQVSVTLTQAEYEKLEKRANACGHRFVGRQLKAEAQAYRDGEHLPTEAIENWLSELSRIWRGIGTNLNQIAHHSNTFERLVLEHQAIELLKEIESKARAFVTKAREE